MIHVFSNKKKRIKNAIKRSIEMALKKVFRFKPHDFMMPFNKMLKKITTQDNIDDILIYPEPVIQKAFSQGFNPNIQDKAQLSYIKYSNIINSPYEIPDNISTPILKEIIKTKEYQYIMKPVIDSKLLEMNDEERATASNIYNMTINLPIKYSNINSFEDM